ncbi:ADIPOR-like receptor SPBC12C2.09c [Lachnellula suecica]|uniref:ADIPOR-like receptor SPBC12C2.09c n=1 Tax=Lachnellula suecica TaxID=602035 RepID=A0A8T9C3S1_9HELO|nr:ADIPOR-like receptor SPBC12C2.09c [Lachnellula suecica]
MRLSIYIRTCSGAFFSHSFQRMYTIQYTPDIRVLRRAILSSSRRSFLESRFASSFLHCTQIPFAFNVRSINSGSFHTFANHSEWVAAFGNQLDYLGVVILMWGSTIPSVYYGFYCDPKLQKVYWSVVSILAAACIVTTLNPRFRSPLLRPYRAAMYAGLGLSALVFIIHGVIIHGWTIQNHRMSLRWMALMGGLNLIGAAVYAARIPERWHPARYDHFGGSHQILHFMVIFAGLAHMVGLLSSFDYLHSQKSPCPI